MKESPVHLRAISGGLRDMWNDRARTAVSAAARRGGVVNMVLALAGFTMAAVVFTYPLVVAPATTIEYGWGDPLLVAYVLNWGQHALVTDPASFMDASFYHPIPNTLSLSEHLVGVSWPTVPFQLFREPLLVYNGAVFVSIVLSGLLFSRYLVRVGVSAGPAWFGGLLFAFTPWRTGQLGHAQLGFTFWIPFTLLAFETWIEGRRLRAASVTGLGVGLVFSSSVYHGFFFGLFFVVYALVRLVSSEVKSSPFRARRLLGHAAVAGLAAALTVAPSAFAYARMARNLPRVNPLETMTDRGADVVDYVNPSSLSLVWGRFSQRTHPYSDIPWEMHAFPGGIALASFAGALVLFAVPSWRRRLLPASASVAGGLAAAGAWLLIVSLGPVAHVAGTALSLPFPYQALHRWVPGFDSMRVPVRASFYVALAGAALAALALSAATARLRPGVKRSAIVFATGLALLDVASVPLPYMHAVDYERVREAMRLAPVPSAGGADVVLPICDALNYASPLASAGQWRPLVNGKSGYLLPENGQIFRVLSEDTFGIGQAQLLRSLGVDRVLVDESRVESPDIASVLEALGREAAALQILATPRGFYVILVRWPATSGGL